MHIRKTWPCRLLIALLLIGNIVGCSGSKDKGDARGQTKAQLRSDMDEMAPAAPGHLEAGNAKQAAKQADAKAVERKIIYTAALNLRVEDFTKAEEDLLRLIEESKGLVETSDITARTGSARSGHWKVRIPPENLAGFRKAAAKLGEAEKNNLDSQEVTEEFYSLIEDVKNKEEELKTFRRMYEQAKTIPDSIAVTEKLERMRQELERIKSRQKVLDNLTSLTKVDVWLYERGAYIPTESPDFATRSGRTFSGSLNALVQFGQAVALIAIALTPWLPLILLLALPFFVIWRRHRLTVKSAAAAVPVLEAAAPTQET